MAAGGVAGAQRRWHNSGSVGFWVYIISGFVIALVVIFVNFSKDEFRNCTETVIATIDDYVEHPRTINHKHTTYDYYIRYEYDGEQYSDIIEDSRKVVKNGKISIDINPDNPYQIVESSKNGGEVFKAMMITLLIYYSPLIIFIFIIATSMKGKGD